MYGNNPQANSQKTAPEVNQPEGQRIISGLAREKDQLSEVCDRLHSVLANIRGTQPENIGEGSKNPQPNSYFSACNQLLSDNSDMIGSIAKFISELEDMFRQ